MARIGIYPGTFNPIHQGHTDFALASAKKCRLDSVYFLPEEQPRNKPNITKLEERFGQINAVVSQNRLLDVFILEDAQFTVDLTLPKLRRRFVDDELFLLVGSDVAEHLTRWPSIETLLQHTKLIIGIRSRDSQADITAALQSLNVPIEYIFTDSAHIASSMYRDS